MGVRIPLHPIVSVVLTLLGISRTIGHYKTWPLKNWLYRIFIICNLLNVYWVILCMLLYLFIVKMSILNFFYASGMFLIAGDVVFKLSYMWIKSDEFLGVMDTLASYPWDGLRTHKRDSGDVTSFGSIRRTDTIAVAAVFCIIVTTGTPTLLSFIRGDNPIVYACWYPFDAYSGNLYYVTFLSQAVTAIALSETLVVFCYIYVKVVLLMCSQLEALEDSLRELRQRAEAVCGSGVAGWKGTALQEPLLPAPVQGVMQLKLGGYIRHHQELYRLMNYVRELYRTLFLVQFVSIAVDICFALYITITIPSYDTEYVLNCLVLVYQTPQLILYCWFGTKLTEKAHGLRQAAYDCEWISASNGFRTCILMMMTRCDQTFVLMVGKFTTVSVDTLITIMQSVGSYMAVMSSLAEVSEYPHESHNNTLRN